MVKFSSFLEARNLSPSAAVMLAIRHVGGSLALGGGFALNKGIVQASGVASILDASRLRKATAVNVALRETLFRHEQAMFAQAQQSAACNATHTVEARLARWLLRSRDLLGGDTLLLTQEFLGQMLGYGERVFRFSPTPFKRPG